MTSRGFRTGTFWPMLGYRDYLSADEFGFECWFAVFEK